MELLAVMASDRSTDPLAPLWERAQQAAEAGDMPGVLFIWKALAEKGAWHICARIGEMYERGADSVRPDIEQALYWYRKAVFEGDDPIAHVGLGRAYYNGSGVQADFEKALEHFQKAGAQGLPQANIYLGLMYYRGVAVTRDSRIAEEYFARAMEADYPVAYAYLARIAFFRGRIGRAISLMLRGIALGSRIARKDPADPRLLGI